MSGSSSTTRIEAGRIHYSLLSSAHRHNAYRIQRPPLQLGFWPIGALANNQPSERGLKDWVADSASPLITRSSRVAARAVRKEIKSAMSVAEGWLPVTTVARSATAIAPMRRSASARRWSPVVSLSREGRYRPVHHPEERA